MASTSLLRRVPAWLLLFVGCTGESDPVFSDRPTNSFVNSDWSTPENAGAAINTTASEFDPSLSPDELSFYFNRNGDIWVARRDCRRCAWQTAVLLGPEINGPAGDGGPRVSVDGHLLFFHSNRAGGFGGRDIYMSTRSDANDDLGWGPAINLGPDVNTSAEELNPEFVQTAEAGRGNLYFHRGAAAAADIYVAGVTRDGESSGPAVLVEELSTLTAGESAPTLRIDGREVVFSSTRVGGFGDLDLWRSTRPGLGHPWSTPENLGLPINSTSTDQGPALSRDGRTLVFVSGRTGGFGGTDIWFVTRTPSGN